MSEIPVYGAIILNKNQDKLCKYTLNVLILVLVMNYNLTSYSFPKGKVNMNESGMVCATREVW